MNEEIRIEALPPDTMSFVESQEKLFLALSRIEKKFANGEETPEHLKKHNEFRSWVRAIHYDRGVPSL